MKESNGTYEYDQQLPLKLKKKSTRISIERYYRSLQVIMNSQVLVQKRISH